MRWVLPLAGCLALSLLLPTDGIRAQAVPGAPAITSVTAADTSLTVTWTAPGNNGGAQIAAYDLRYINSDAFDKADANWTLVETIWSSGDLEYDLTGLGRDTSYDVRLRAVNANGDGPWSEPPFTQATNDHGETGDTATAVTVGDSVSGRMGTTRDVDYFSFTLTETTDVWMYTSGSVDTVGELFESDGTWVTQNDDAGRSEGVFNFGIAGLLDAGTYHLKVSSYRQGDSGPYTLHTTTGSDSGTSFGTATVMTPGVPVFTRLANASDDHYFKFEVTSTTTAWIRAAMPLDTVGSLYNSKKELIARNDDGFVTLFVPFSLLERLSPGTYYLKVHSYFHRATGPYVLRVDFTDGPGNTAGTALPVALSSVNVGRLTSSTDRDYYRLDLNRVTHTRLYSRHTDDGSRSVMVLDAQSREIDLTAAIHPAFHNEAEFDYTIRLGPGTYYIVVSSTQSSAQQYLFRVQPSIPLQRVLNVCTEVESSQSDLLYGCQWHLNNTGQFGGAGHDINVEEAWGNTRGEGVSVAIVDDGMQSSHDDLADNVVLSRNHTFWSWSDGVYHPDDTHGTAVAGLVAARDNDIGVRGVAPRASIYAYDLLHSNPSTADIVESLTLNLAETAVSNNSWGYAGTGTPNPLDDVVEEALERGVREGFGGKGISYVFAAGNEAGLTDDANFDELNNHYAVISVCAVNHADVRSDFSESGASLWVCGPSNNGSDDPSHPGITTTTTRNNYRIDFGGTSAAAPIVSGVVALMRAASPALTWRDVKLILAASARQVDPTNTGWEDGGLLYGRNPDMERYSFNHEYGFGMVDAGAAVALARNWTNAPEWREISASSTGDPLQIPDAPEAGSPTTVTSTVTLDHNVDFIEFMEINVDIEHDAFRHLQVDLVSPSGTVSKLSRPGTSYIRLWFFVFPFEVALDEPYRFGSARHLGEDSSGEWTLRITDHERGFTGKLKSWSLTAYGHGRTPGPPSIDSVQSGDTSLTIAWNAPDASGIDPVTSYDLRYLREDALDRLDSSWTKVASIWTTGDLSYELTGLAAGYHYDLEVRAVNDEGPGSWSDTHRAATNPVKPGAPLISEVTARNLGLNAVWEEPSFTGAAAITSYDLRHIRTDATARDDDDWTAIASAGTRGTDDLYSHRLTSLENDVSYDVQVRAHNVVGAGDWSAITAGTPEVNVNAEFVAGQTGMRTVAENALPATPVGNPFVATDANNHTPVFSISGSGGLFSIDSATGQLMVASALDYETAPTHSFKVHVADGLNSDGAPDTSIDDTLDVTVTVEDFDEDFVIIGPSSIEWPEENSTIVATYDADDPEDQPITWSVRGVDGDTVTINSSGHLRFIEAPNYEKPADADGDNEYQAVVAGSDGVNEALFPVEITVTDVDEPAVVFGPAHVTVAEESDILVGMYIALDPEGEKTNWRSLSGKDAGKFSLNDLGFLKFREPPDFEARGNRDGDNVYEVTVNAIEVDAARGDPVGSLDVEVTVTNRNDPPTITGAARPGPFPENSSPTVGSYSAVDPEGGTVILSLTGNDADAFTLTNGGVRFRAPPDFENPVDRDGDNEYRLTLRATDGEEVSWLSVRFEVEDEDEHGNVTLSSQQPRIGSPLVATLEEPDDYTSLVWSWERSTNPTSGFTLISGADAASYAPSSTDRDHYLRVRASYTDTHGDKSPSAISRWKTLPDPGTNAPPRFSPTLPTFTIAETAQPFRAVGSPLQVSDDQDDPLVFTLTVVSGGTPSFDIDRESGQIRVATGANLDYEATSSYEVEVTVADSFGTTDTATFTISVTNVDEPPVAGRDTAVTDEDTRIVIDVLTNDYDPEGEALTVVSAGKPGIGTVTVMAGNRISYQPNVNAHGVDNFTYRVSDGTQPVSTTATVEVTVLSVNDAPTFGAATAERTVSESAADGDPVGAPLVATDPDGHIPVYYLSAGNLMFGIEPHTGQISVASSALLDARAEPTHLVTVRAEDQFSEFSTIDVTITVTEARRPGAIAPIAPLGLGGGFAGGGGPPPGPQPSEVDFEWTVEHDIEALDESNEAPTGAWSDGATAWILDNPNGAGDAVYAYDLATGERVEDREFELHETNRAPRGVWSDRVTMWVSDSGQERLFAYDLATGERVEEREIELTRRNDDARGIWSDGTTMWVLDDRRNAVFAYDLESGEFLAEYALDEANDQPHGVWSDGVTLWISNHDPKRLYAYRLPVAAEDRSKEDLALGRVTGEDFDELGRVSNNSPRGIWSDGDVMYVVDASDGKVYSYNMPDAIDARLSSLTLEGIDIGEFDPSRTAYEGGIGEGVTETAVTAEAMQERTDVAIDPPDADGDDTNGHRVALTGVSEITVTVTSADGARRKVYRVSLRRAGDEPWPHCLRGDIAVGFSLVVYEGGRVQDLASCAQSRDVAALYALHDGVYVTYILGAPDFVNQRFAELYPDGVPPLTTLVAGSSGPSSDDPVGDIGAPGSWPHCLRGDIVEGFSLVLYAGGSVEELATCAERLNVTALYALAGGEWFSYVIGAPDFVNQPFRGLFADGLPAATPLVAKGDEPQAAGSEEDSETGN